MERILGIDMASGEYVTFNEEGLYETVLNTKGAIRAHLKSLPKGTVLGMESTGGYQKLLADMAFEAGFIVFVVQPAKVKRFRSSAPDLRGKTDRIDARAIHDYVKTYRDRLHPYEPLPKFEAELRKLSRTRDALVRKMTSIRTQLASLGDSPKRIEMTLFGLKKRVAELEVKIAEMLAQAPEAAVLRTIPGVKACVISAVLPALRTKAFKDKYSLDSYAGMDLRPWESGKLKGRRHITKEGDKYIRRAMYMAAMSGVRSKAWSAYYKSLLEDKKLRKIQALNVLARKILHTVFGVYRTQLPFQTT